MTEPCVMHDDTILRHSAVCQATRCVKQADRDNKST
jgi:hypothetical protein